MKSSISRSGPAWVSLGFALSGMLTGGLMQADVVAYERSFQLNHEQVAFWLSIFSVLTAAGGFAGGVLADRLGAGRVYLGSMILSGAGLVAFSWTHPAPALTGYLLAGLGVGGLIVGNILVAQGNDISPNYSLNCLHSNHAIARLAGVFISMFALGISWQTSYLALGAMFCMIAAVYRPLPMIAPPAVAGDIPSAANEPDWHRTGVCLGFLTYMIAEMVLITWLPAYFEQEKNWSPASSRAVYAGFLFGLIAGRQYCGRKWPRELPASVCRNLAVAHAMALGAFMAVDHEWVTSISLFVIGCCQGPGWPSLFSFALRRAGPASGKMTAVTYIVCCVGIVIATAGSGVIAHRAGISSIFYVVVVAHAMFSVVFYRLLSKRPIPLP